MDGLTFIEDTRQQTGKHEAKHVRFAEMGVRLVRCKLAFGDYALPPAVAVDTKADIAELAYDIDHDHARFKREVVGARDAGVRLVVLVENTDGVRDLAGLAEWSESPEDYAQRKFAKHRLHPIPFDARFMRADADYDPRILDKLETEEAAQYLIRLGIEGLARVRLNNGLTPNDRSEQLVRENCLRGARAVQAALLRECGVARSVRAIEAHALRMHMSLRVREQCLQCGCVGVRLNRQSGMCTRCTEFMHVEEERAFNALLEAEAAAVQDGEAIERLRREYTALRQRNSRLCGKHGFAPKSKRSY